MRERPRADDKQSIETAGPRITRGDKRTGQDHNGWRRGLRLLPHTDKSPAGYPGPPPSAPAAHGTISAYSGMKCRCQYCRDAGVSCEGLSMTRLPAAIAVTTGISDRLTGSSTAR